MPSFEAVFGQNKFEVPQEAVDIFRAFIDDFDVHNVLIDDFELTDADLERCLRLAVDDWNVTTPKTTYSFLSHPAVSLCFLKAAIVAFQQAGKRQTRNQLSYSDGGITVAINDKTALYQSWIGQHMQEYETKKRMLKSQNNAESIYTQTYSEYASTDIGRGR